MADLGGKVWTGARAVVGGNAVAEPWPAAGDEEDAGLGGVLVDAAGGGEGSTRLALLHDR